MKRTHSQREEATVSNKRAHFVQPTSSGTMTVPHTWRACSEEERNQYHQIDDALRACGIVQVAFDPVEPRFNGVGWVLHTLTHRLLLSYNRHAMTTLYWTEKDRATDMMRFSVIATDRVLRQEDLGQESEPDIVWIRGGTTTEQRKEVGDALVKFTPLAAALIDHLRTRVSAIVNCGLGDGLMGVTEIHDIVTGYVV